MAEMKCQGRTHVFVEEAWGGTPWCRCGLTRNPAHKRSLLDRLLGRPRQPEVEVTVPVSSSLTAAEAMPKFGRFTLLCEEYDVYFVKADGKTITVKGKPEKIKRFQARHETLYWGGLI